MSSIPSTDKPPRMGLRFALAALLIVVLAAAATATAGLEKVSTIAGEALPSSSHIATPKGLILPAYDGDPQTFLLIGSDRRSMSRDAADRLDPPHSDTLLLVHLDPNQGQTSVLSIPRDLLVSITAPDGHVTYPAKINEAYTIGSYYKGHDPAATLAAQTIEKLLGIRLNGIVDVTFHGFIDVVDKLGCVYVNVDHRYYNPVGDSYSAIDLQPGYQRLCYNNALSYVRYRHDDSDFVRVARQQDFIRDIREQAKITLGNIDRVSRSVGRAVRSTFSSSPAQLEILAKLLLFSQQKPLRQVKFRFSTDNTTIGGASYVTASPSDIEATVHDFLYGHGQVSLSSRPSSSSSSSSHPGHHHGRSTSPSLASQGLTAVPSADVSQAVNAGVGVPFRMLYPRVQSSFAVQQGVRAYALRDRGGRLRHAYAAVFKEGAIGAYYDVEGTDWQDPPLIAHPTDVRHVDGRTYMFVNDGSHIHVIAWREHGALYWVTNTLTEDLSNRQMLSIAQSVRPLG